MGLAFNFAGPPGTGKTICAEAIAHELGKRLLVVRYAEMESLWAGETGKNVASVFRAAQDHEAVLFFDEADAIASRRFQSVTQGYQREANAVVNVLLKELEEFDGVVIFATNLASNFDPAFERRIRTHILFEMPDAAARAKIWRVQLHARKTPLAPDVNFEELGEKYAVAGGDIKNAVLKAAQMATAEPGPDSEKKIHQRHFIDGIEEVLSSKKVMEQSLFEGDGSAPPQMEPAVLAGISGAFEQLAQNDKAMGEDLKSVIERAGVLESHISSFPEILNRFDESQKVAQTTLRSELTDKIQQAEGELLTQLTGFRTDLVRLEERFKSDAATRTESIANLSNRVRAALTLASALGGCALALALGALALSLLR